MIKTKCIVISLTLLLLVACNSNPGGQSQSSDPLPSWNEGKAKQNILDYVEDVTNPTCDCFVAVPDRIAVFDNDGTLWSEQPAYFQLSFAMDRVKKMADANPEWKNTQPYKAVIENDMATLGALGEHALIELVMATHAGNTVEEFETYVTQWLSEARHPRFDRPYTDLVYQPMLELLAYLKSKDFKTFIISAGGIEFMRPWVEEVYGIPRDQVLGSSIKTEFQIIDGTPQIIRLPEVDFIDDKEGKPIGIHKFIGRKPIFSSGNSDGDLQMMQYTASGKGKRFMLYLHHTDAEREWAYDRESHIGRLDKGLDEALEKGWTVIDMKNDWKVIYPFQLENP